MKQKIKFNIPQKIDLSKKLASSLIADMSQNNQTADKIIDSIISGDNPEIIAPNTVKMIKQMFPDNFAKRKRAVYDLFADKIETIVDNLTNELSNRDYSSVDPDKIANIIDKLISKLRLLREDTTDNDSEHAAGLNNLKALDLALKILKENGVKFE